MSLEDTGLVQSTLNGDMAAFRDLVDRHSGRVHNIVYQLVGDGEDARDIAQEVFLRLYQTLHKYNAKLSFGAWLYRLTVNLAIDYRRRNARHRSKVVGQVEEIVASKGLGPDVQVENNELQGAIQRLVGTLSTKKQKVFVLRDLQGFSTEEVAAIVACRPATVRVHLARARKQIGKALLKHFPDLVGAHKLRSDTDEMS